jgi:HAD superfamily hydrolase (TIGR01549 family)
MAIRAVFFDVGETLVNESRLWDGWAAYLGVPSEEFRAAIDDVVARGEDYSCVFDRFRPGFDLVAVRRERTARGDLYRLEAGDLYPDALACLKRLRELGYVVGIVGNQPREAEEALRHVGFVADHIASSTGWGVAKPSPLFFARVSNTAKLPPSAIAYVGDGLDNDVIPARNAGMVAVFVERGPWGHAHAKWPEVAQADVVLKSLDELPDKLVSLAAGGGIR